MQHHRQERSRRMWSEVIDAVKAIGGWIAYNKNNRELREQRLIDALVQMHRAANLTRAYLADVVVAGVEGDRLPRDRDPRIQDLRREVSENWLQVGRALSQCSGGKHIQEVIEDLRNRCFEKGRYWADPESWKNEGVDIELGQLVTGIADAIER